MSLMSVSEVAEFLGVQQSRVQRLAREHLLVVKEENEEGEPMFDQNDVSRYKEFAERLGGL